MAEWLLRTLGSLVIGVPRVKSEEGRTDSKAVKRVAERPPEFE